MGSQVSRTNFETTFNWLEIILKAISGLPYYWLEYQHDPDIKSLDSTLQKPITQIMSSIAAVSKDGNLSLDYIGEVTAFFVETIRATAKVIIENAPEIWTSQEVKDLVKDYFQSTNDTLYLCNTLDECLKRATNQQLSLQLALQKFANEQQSPTEGYVKTLQELENFTLAGDPFTEEFFSKLCTLRDQQMSMLEKLSVKRAKLDRQMESFRLWEKVSSVISIAASAIALICSVVVVAVAAFTPVGPVVSAIAATTNVLVEGGVRVISLWNKYEKETREQWDEIMISMQKGTTIKIVELENIWVLAEKMKSDIHSLVENANKALGDDDAVVLVMDHMKKEMSRLMETIDDLAKDVVKFRGDILEARRSIMKHVYHA